MTGFAQNVSDRTLRSWLNAGPVDRGIGGGLIFLAKESSARQGQATWILRYQRHEYAQRDKSWAAKGIDVQAVLAEVAKFDPRVAASMRLMNELGLRRKESVMHRPYAHVVPFDQTRLPEDKKLADEYVSAKGKGGRVRWIALQTEAQRAAVAHARTLVDGRDAHMGNPAHPLKRNLRRLDYALEKFGLTNAERGVTSHGLRHGNFHELYEDVTGEPPPVRGGGLVPAELDRAARLAVSARAGHSRLRAAGAYLGAIRKAPGPQSAQPKPTVGPKPHDDDAAPRDA